MKRKILALLSATFAMTFLSGCSSYQYTSGTLEEISGTYKLKTITKKDAEDNDYSYKDEIGAEAYFTIGLDGYSYYAYKDNSKEWKATQMFAVFAADEDKEGYYKSLELVDGTNHNEIYYWNMEVGCLDEPPMGFNNKTKTLSYTIHHEAPNWMHKKEIPYQYVCYERINGETGLAALNKATGQNFSFKKPFELSHVDGMHVLEVIEGDYEDYPKNPDYGRFEYGILDTDSFHDNKMNFYYSLTSDKVHTQTEVTVTYPESYGIFKNVQLNFSIVDGSETRDFTFTLNNGNYIGSMFEYALWSEPDESGTSYSLYSNYFNKYYGDAKTVDELIEVLLDTAE